MFGSQFHRSAAISESNIPIPKRLSSGIKKSKKCAQLPELQKYIETIIKASNEYDSEDTSLSDKDRFPKERKFGRYSVYKGIENKKDEKIKNDVNVSRCKSYIKSKEPVLESVSRGVQINSNSLAPEFEDPRNWNITKTQNLGPSVQIEKFLKQFYPNPYHLENVNEFKDSKVDEKDHLRDGTLPDVIISKANIHTEVDIEKTDNDLETADIEIKPCKRESKTTISDPKLKKCIKSPSKSDNNKMDDPKSITPSTIGKTKTFLSNTSSQASSVESLSDTFRESHLNFKKRKNLKSKNKLKHLKSEEDYDIGKLKLLNISDSDDAASREKSKIKGTINPVVDEKSSTLSEEAYKTEELNDLKEIYDMMYKATESLFCISSKDETKEDSTILTENNTTELNNENRKPCDFDNNIRSSNSSHSGRQNVQTTEKPNDKSSIQIEKNFGKEETSPKGSSLLNVLLKEDKFEFKSSPEDTEVEQVQERVPEPVQHQVCSLPNSDEANLEAREPKKEEQSNSSNNREGDEVLEYMFGCLKKFTNKRKPEEESNALPEDKKTLKKTVSSRKFGKRSVTEINIEKPTISRSSEATDDTNTYQKHSIESLLQKNFPEIRNIQCKYAAALNEINKKPGNKIRCHRRSLNPFTKDIPFERNKRNELPSVINQVATGSSTNMQPETVQYSTTEVNENPAVLTPVMVESQNELGGCTEETQEAQINEDMRFPKPVLPLSVSRREKSKMNTWKKLKDVLEAEEKLLSSEFEDENSKSENEILKNLAFNEAQGLGSCNETDENVDSVESHFDDFKCSSSNFLICENSLVGDMKSVISFKPNIAVPVSASLCDLNKGSRSTMFCPKLPLRKVPLPEIRESYVLMHNYVVQQEISQTSQKTDILYIAQSFCMKLTTNVCNKTEEAPLKSSECLVHIIVKPVEQSLIVKSENALISPPESTLDREEDKPVEALIEAIEETEEKVSLLEKRTESTQSLYSRNSEMFRPSERLKYELSENEVGRMNDKKKIHELLLRTYNLQEKLQQYLERFTSGKPTSVSCPLMQRNLVDASLKSKNKIDFEVKPNYSLPVVHWHLETAVTDTKSKMDESVAVNVIMVDHGTTYDPPAVEGICEKGKESDNEVKDSPNSENDDRFSENMKNDEDDRSSNHSFKSSNDFSVTSEGENRIKDVTNTKSDRTNTKFYKKIFNEIELFRQSFEADKIERRQHEEANPKEPTELLDRQLTQYDPKIQAKVLKTVFKGKKSMTELTIGLKDVPMTKVGNISVEKTKFSSNHTKISISISKEHSEPTHKNVSSSYYFNDTRPSLSSCLTDYSRLKDVDSKTSESLNEDSDEDEEDYKSVCSTIDNSDSEGNEKEKTEPKKDKTPEVPSAKSFTKHRFDFYRKMSTDLDTSRSKLKSQTNSVCRYKELEPLKQALTEMQIRMRNIKREALYDSNDYFERALKLAKMSAGFCQSCGNRAVIPNDTFGYYRTLLPRRYSHHRRSRHFRPNLTPNLNLTPNPSIYSLRSSSADINDHFYDLGIKHGSYMLNPAIHTSRTVLRTSLHDMPILFEGCNLQKLG